MRMNNCPRGLDNIKYTSLARRNRRKEPASNVPLVGTFIVLTMWAAFITWVIL